MLGLREAALFFCQKTDHSSGLQQYPLWFSSGIFGECRQNLGLFLRNHAYFIKNDKEKAIKNPLLREVSGEERT